MQSGPTNLAHKVQRREKREQTKRGFFVCVCGCVCVCVRERESERERERERERNEKERTEKERTENRQRVGVPNEWRILNAKVLSE